MGVPGNEAPLWATILDAAKDDPLRAQEIEDNLTLDWLQRYLVYRAEENKILKEEQQKLGSR